MEWSKKILICGFQITNTYIDGHRKVPGKLETQKTAWKEKHLMMGCHIMRGGKYDVAGNKIHSVFH